MLAAVALAGILYLAGNSHPGAVTAAGEQHSWLASAAFPWPPLLAAAVAVTVAAAPWLSRPWRRTAWIVATVSDIQPGASVIFPRKRCSGGWSLAAAR